MRTSLTLGGMALSIVLMMAALFTYAGKGPMARPVNRDLYLRQLKDNDAVPQQITHDYAQRQNYQTVQMLMALSGCFFLGSVAFFRFTNRPQVVAGKPVGSAEL